jgi:hypothetical protein
MANASTVSEAGRMLSRKRWGDTRVRSLIVELEQRRGELGPDHLRELRELVDERSEARG